MRIQTIMIIMNFMKQLNKLESILYIIGGFTMTIGAGLYAFFLYQKFSCWLMLLGAIIFVSMQIRQKYLGTSVTIHRLRKIMFLSHACFLLAGVLIVEDAYNFIKPFFSSSIESYNLYVTIFYHNWVVLLLIAAILEAYSIHRISTELTKKH